MNLHSLSIVVLFLFILINLTASISNPSPFRGDVSINCGSKGTSATNNGKEWIGDIIQSKSSSVLQMKGSSSTSTVIPKLISVDPVPHKTARISKTQFSYEFHVSPGQKLLRLHFNPTSYKGFKGFDDLFTVETGPFTLLNNFSASLTAEALEVDSFAKEFCLNVQENQQLHIIFSPESSRSLDTYAFINGIEIFSVPPSLSYFERGYVGFQLVGEKSLVYFDYNTALEILHRVEIKQNSVHSAGNYDHMFPKWTSRNANKINNNTWKMPVDVGFKYLIRVHLSEVGLKIAGTGDNMFEVLINEMIAHTNKDVVNRMDENSIPWYRDYMVVVRGNKKEGKRDILVSLKSHDNLIGAHAFFLGFEIFKLSNSDNSLASPNPLPLARESPSHTIQTLFFLLFKRNAIATVAMAIISFLCIVVHKLLEIQEANTNEEENKRRPSVRAERLCRIFSLDKIQSATKNFSDTLLIGWGGFGKVYKGHIDKEKTVVAIKRLKSSSNQGAHEFLTEIETLSELRHVNLVSLIGYCNEQREMILVYEYMPCGTLADHIYKLARENNTRSSLTWKQFLDICIGAGRGLDYLHTGHGVIHRDVKASNILLDENFIAKVSDFGLAKPENKSKLETHISTNVKGTFGYLDPNYYRTHKLTRKSDTYAFGVVLLEVLCMRPAIDLMVPDDERVLSVWARDKINKGEADQIVSISLREEISSNSLKTFVGVAQRCLSDEPKKRPTMSQIVSQLELAFEQQETKLLLEIKTTISDDSSVQTGQPTIFSTSVQNFTLPPNEQTNSNVVTAQLPHDNKDGSSVQTSQPTVFSTALQNFTLHPNEKTNNNAVIAQLPHDDKDGSSVQTRQPTIFSTSVQNHHSNEQTNSNVVIVQLPHDHKDGSSFQTRQPTVFSTVVHNFIHPSNEQTNSNVVIAQLSHDDKAGPSVQTRQPGVFSTTVHNFTLPLNQQTNIDVVTTQLPHDDKDGSSVQTRQPTVFSTAVHNFALPPNEQTINNVVSAQLPLKENVSPSLSEFDLGTSTSATSESCSTSGLCRRFSLEEIKTATGNLDKNSIISKGGYSDVYKGFIEDGATTVAIKRMEPEYLDARKFLDKIDMSSKLRHLHVVSPIGYCDEDGEMLLVYDYMPRGSLNDHLRITKKNPPIMWKQRLQICIGAAKGLHYLNTHDNEYHNMCREVRTRKILLDEKWVAKVLLAPCYIWTVKNNVYSFGLVLFQVLFTKPGKLPNYTEWAESCRRGTLQQYIEPNLYSQIAPKCLIKFVETAIACVNETGSEHPAIGDVLRSLEFAMQLQEAAEQSGSR